MATKVSNIIIRIWVHTSMTWNIFTALNELKSDIIVVDSKLLSNYKCAHAKHVFTIIIYNSPCSLPEQSVAWQSTKSNLAVTITANKMDANNETIDPNQQEVLGIYWCIIHWSDPRLIPHHVVLFMTIL